MIETGKFLIDYGIKLDDIDRLSFQDVYENRFDPAVVRGRAILVGATALELGDEFATQQAGTLSGVFVHALAYESIKARRTLFAPNAFLVFLLACGVVILLRPNRLGTGRHFLARRHLVVGSVLLAGPIVIQGLAPISTPVAPMLLAQIICLIWTARAELKRRAEAIVREREAGLLHLAMHEPETELPNRRALVADLARRLERSSDGVLAVVAVGLDRYAVMRGAVGYSLANKAVREVAMRLGETCPSAEISHLSTSVLGFAVVREDQARLVEEIARIEALPVGYVVDGHSIDVYLRFGIVYAAPDQRDAERLLEQATIALDDARRLNQRTSLFNEQTFADPSFNLALMTEMSRGLEAGHLSMHYQAKASASDGQILGAEALVRWRHPERGNIPPDSFIGTAEETGAIRELTEWTIVQALSDSRRLRDNGYRLLISVNISGRLLADRSFCDTVLAIVDGRGAELCFEITETAVIDNPEDATAAIAKFHKAGIKVSIDDYGVGLSSLSYLKMLDADELKIDKSLVEEVVNSQRDRLIVRSTIDLAHSLGMVVVAEGVETSEVQSTLALLGCDVIQGYLISKPLPISEFESLLSEVSAGASEPIGRDGAQRRAAGVS